jgi:hypothetical protein
VGIPRVVRHWASPTHAFRLASGYGSKVDSSSEIKGHFLVGVERLVEGDQLFQISSSC